MSSKPQVVLTANAPKPLPQFSQALTYNGMVYLSGNIGMHPDTSKLVEGTVKDRTVTKRPRPLCLLSTIHANQRPIETSPQKHLSHPGRGREQPAERAQGECLHHDDGQFCDYERGV